MSTKQQNFVSAIRCGVLLLLSEHLAREGVPHGFTSRTHGFGARDRGEHDREQLSCALNLPRLAYMKQVHGRSIRTIHGNEHVPECDGVTTQERDLGLIVHTADCVPLLFWASDVNAVAAVHAGWRGTLARVAEEAVSSLGGRPEKIHVAIGPSIRACCFEVGDEVVEAFRASGRELKRISREGSRGRRHVDLITDNRDQLIACGIPEAQIYDSGCCTMCENDRFYSYRREGKGVGRLMGVIAVK